MRIYYKKPLVRIDDVLMALFLIISFTLVIVMVADLATKKSDVVVDENYKGKYVKVLCYECFNTDSTYKYYYKPKEVKVKVLETYRNGDILIQDGKYKENVSSFRLDKKYKVGQNIKLEKTFYPKIKYTDIYNKGKYNKK